MTLFAKDQEKAQLQPNSDQIFELVYNCWRVHILKTAIQLDIFTAIANDLSTVEKLVSAKNWATRPTRVLLDGLCPMFLSKKGSEYMLTPTSQTFLVRNKETYAGEALQHILSCNPWQQLLEAIKTGQREIPEACSPGFSAFWVQDAAIEAMRMSRIAESLEMWRTLGFDPDAKRKVKVLDLASGCGIKSLVLAKNNPNADITCIDWAGVLDVAKKLADKWDILKQVKLRPGDVTTMDYGDCEFDAILLGQITYHLSTDQNKAVLKKAYRALKPGGLLVIHTPIADEERCKSEALVLAVVLFTLYGEKGELYTFSEYKAMLENVGFSDVTKHSESLISARKREMPTTT